MTLLKTLVFFGAVYSVSPVSISVPTKYHTYSEVETFLNNIVKSYPQLSRLYSVGKSVEGRNLFVIAIGNSAEEKLIPKVKYVGNMHGNEVVSRQILIYFIEYLLTNYNMNRTITSFLNTTEIHIMPSMNPDGFEQTIGQLEENTCNGLLGRNNLNNFDLNRNFPDFFENNPDPLQAETLAVMDWLNKTQFVLSANLHGGTLVANYPYDNNKKGKTEKSPSPDDDVFVYLAKTYSQSHRDMSGGNVCGDFNFPDGITNGAEWYAVRGGMQDYNYLKAGCMEILLEVSCCKYPSTSLLPDFWEANRDALFNYLSRVHIGVKGVVTSNKGYPIQDAEVTVKGREDFVQRTTKNGEYWRLLLPGEYTLMVKAEGYISAEIKVVVPEERGSAVLRNVTLKRVSKFDLQLDSSLSASTSTKYPAQHLVLMLLLYHLVFDNLPALPAKIL